MNLLEVIRQQVPIFSHIDINPILTGNSDIVGWNCVSYLKDGFPFSGGTHSSKDVATRICVAEALERVLFLKIYKSDFANDFLISEFPSTCGFACGFDDDKTRIRSICEGLERWAWSQWIDGRHTMSTITSPNIDKLSQTLSSIFTTTHYYKKDFFFHDLQLQFCVFLGEKDHGVFAGSRVCSQHEDPWQHSIIEAFRNFRNFEHAKFNNVDLSREDIVRRRAVYFGYHKEDAYNQISRCKEVYWPSPSLKLLKKFQTDIPNVHLWRCVLNNWMSWDSGPESRFVY